jgi:hypothetical protein
MSIFRIYDSDFGIKINGVNYDFQHVQDLQIEDPEMTRLTRGANASNKTGLIYKEGIKEPKKWTVTIMNMSLELKGVLDAAYNDRSRMDVYCISRIDGSSKMAKEAILSQQPQQLSIVDGPESMNVSLIFETFDSSEVHKS